MTKLMKILIIVTTALLLASCSKAYRPTNYQKKKKNKKCDCSRWSYYNVKHDTDLFYFSQYGDMAMSDDNSMCR